MFGRNKVEAAISADWQSVLDAKTGAISITGKYVPPHVPRRAGWLAGLLFIVLCVGLLLPMGNAAAMGIGFVALLLVSGFVIYPALVKLHSQKLRLGIMADSIKFPGGWGGKTYSRMQPIEFRVEPHQKGMQEEQREARTGHRASRIYREAIEVVMQYGEKRVVLAEMLSKDLEKAKALVIRLQGTCEKFDRLLAHMADQMNMPEGGKAKGGEFGPEWEVR